MSENRAFAPGDRIVFREWDEMVDEFGIDDDTGHIDCQYYFTDRMRELCGREFTVDHINDFLGGTRVFLDDDGETDGLFISTDMIRHADDPDMPVPEYAVEDLLAILEG